MKALLIALALFPTASAFAGLAGTWHLTGFQLNGERYCAQPRGQIIYEAGGGMSVSIDCAGEPDKSIFYAGRYEIHGQDIAHTVAHASDAALVGRKLVRRAEELTDRSLV